MLAHLFLNYMLDNGVAYSNFVNFNGYQPPLNEIQPDTLVSKGVIPENLANCVLTEARLRAQVAAGDDPDDGRASQLWQNGTRRSSPGRRQVYPRWLWPAFALPGVVWLLILFLLPLYAVIGVAFGTVDPILLTGVPAWNPLDWNPGWMSQVLGELTPGGV